MVTRMIIGDNYNFVAWISHVCEKLLEEVSDRVLVGPVCDHELKVGWLAWSTTQSTDYCLVSSSTALYMHRHRFICLAIGLCLMSPHVNRRLIEEIHRSTTILESAKSEHISFLLFANRGLPLRLIREL